MADGGTVGGVGGDAGGLGGAGGPGRGLTERDLREHAAFMERLAVRLVGDVHLAQDVVQEALAAAWARRAEPRRSLRAWLSRVVRNQALMARRGAARRRRREELVAVRREVAGPDEHAARLETQARLARAVRGLPQPYRDVVALRFLDGLDMAEIAARTDVSESTVRTRVQRALALLRAVLDEQHEGDSRIWCAGLLGVPRRAVVPTGAAVPLGAGAATAGSIVTGVAALISKKWTVGLLLVLLIGLFAGGLRLVGGHDDGAAPDVGTDAAQRDDARDRRRHPVRAGESDRGTAALGDAGVLGPAGSDPFADVDRERDLFGIVRGTGREPIAGARVEVFAQLFDRASVLRQRAPEERVAGPSSTTAEDGTFALRLSPGDEVELRVTAESFGEVLLPGCLAGERVDVTLVPAAALTVTVRRPDGLPCEGAGVSIRRFVEGLKPVVRRRGATDTDGEVTFGGLTPGDLYLDVEHPDFGAPPTPTLSIDDGGTHRYDVALTSGRTIAGIVVDTATGTGVPSAVVGEGWLLQRAVRSGSDGRFELRGFTGDRRTMLHCLAPGYGRAQLVPPDEGEIAFRLVRGDIVVGRVVGPDGSALAGALVSAVGSHHTNDGQEIDSVSSPTDATGGFRLEGLRRDMPHTLVVQARGAGKLLRDLLPRAEGPGLISLGDLRLPQGRSISGVLLDSDGHRVRGDVEVRSLTPRPAGTYYGPSESRRTDDLGRFRFTALAPDHYEVEARVPGRPMTTTECVLGADDDVEGLRLQLPVAQSLAIQVTTTAGLAIPGAEVILDSPDYVFSATTDVSGRAVVSSSHAAPWTVRVWPPATGVMGRTYIARVVEDVDPAAGPLRVELVDSVHIRGRVTDDANLPLPRMYVRASLESAPGEIVASVVADGDGAFDIAVPQGGPWRLVVDGARRSAASHIFQETLPVRAVATNVAAPSDGVELRAVALAADRTLLVRVTTPSGRPLAGAAVIVSAAGGAPHPSADARTTATDTAGVARFERLTPQRVRVFVEHGSADVGHRDLVRPDFVTVTPGGDVIEISFRQGVPLEGVVRASDGTLVVGALVHTSLMSGLALSESVTDSAGRFRTRGVAGTDHQFYVRYESGSGVVTERYIHGVKPGIDLELSLD